jgi:hypothetical protein
VGPKGPTLVRFLVIKRKKKKEKVLKDKWSLNLVLNLGLIVVVVGHLLGF